MKDSDEDIALKEMSIPKAREALEQAQAKAQEKQEQLCRLSRALAVLASASVRSHVINLFSLLSSFVLLSLSLLFFCYFQLCFSFIYLFIFYFFLSNLCSQ